MSNFFEKILDFFAETHVFEQMKDVDAEWLFTNPWFWYLLLE
jgi:hypothetical protein